jgi:hypothetical protein
MKHKNFLTGTKLGPSRRSFYLGMSAALLLGGCDPSYTYHSLTGTRAKEDVPGMRRTPVLNKRSHSAPAAASPEEGGLPPSSENTPYDQYDANGNEVSANTGSEDSNFFTRLFSSDKQEVKAPQYARKPLPGNPYSPITSAAAPVVGAQVKDIEKAPEPLEPAALEAASLPATENGASASTPVNETAANEPASEQKQGGFFDRIATFFDGGSKQDEQQQAESSQPAREVAKEAVKEPEASTVPDVKVVKEVPGYNAGEADSGSDKESLLGSISSHFVSDSKENEEKTTYPKLSSVPATPTEFDTVKQEHQNNVSELKADHGVALQDKESLDREVSGLPPESNALPVAQPELAMPAPPAAPASEEKLPAPDSLAKAPEEKSIFSHFTFSDTAQPSVPAEPVKEAAVEEQPAPQPQEEVKQSQPLFEPAGKLLGDASVKESEAEGQQAVKHEEHKEEAAAPQPVFSLKESGMEEQPAPQPQEEAKQSQPVFEPAEKLLEDTADLPSPEIIKSMRPSRYEARRKQAQNSDY